MTFRSHSAFLGSRPPYAARPAPPLWRRAENGAMAAERLQKLLAAAGLGSRRRAEELLREGRVRINGQLAQLGDRADPQRDRVTVDGQALPTATPTVLADDGTYEALCIPYPLISGQPSKFFKLGVTIAP